MNTSTHSKQAIVMGGSVAGLLAARALASHFTQVIVVERDPQPESPIARKGVPQGHHVHVLLKSGELALEEFFPGIVDELVENGAQKVDFSKGIRWYHFGHWKMRYDSGFHVMVQSRPLLEHTIRQRLHALGNVSFYYGYAVDELLTTPDKTAVVGVRVHQVDDRASAEDLTADLVVDASGRGSKTPQWLEDLGYARPAETQVKIGLTYSSQFFEAPAQHNEDWTLMALNPAVNGGTRAGYVFPVEGNRWLVTFGGYSGDKTPQTEDTFVEYAKGLATPDIYNVIKDLTPISDVKVFNVPQTTRRHYESLSRFPAGLVVLGDSFCAFDPVFGQGMSSAAKQAVALKQVLAQHGYDGTAEFSRRFHKRIAGVVLAPWLLATSEDFRYPKTEGKKAFFIPFLHWYSGHVFALSATDKEVYNAFRIVMHLQSGPEALFKPSIVWKVLRRAFGGKSAQPVAELTPAPEQA
jgi:2-polyprenyl-6-methoxyphenol hydroxylase-like FAD-dependent oxidoreductase